MADVDEEIREIKREIIESRGLLIKSSNLTNSLGADLKSIAKRQVGYERRFTWNSAAAYVLFAAICFGVFWLASSQRYAELEAQVESLEGETESLRAELTDETERAERRTRAEASASEFYRLIRERRRSEAVEAYAEIRHEELSPAEAAFFRDTVDQFQIDLSVTAYNEGLDLVRTGRYAEAAESFQEALRLSEDAPHTPAVRLELARALRRLGHDARAKELAAEVAEQTVDRELHDDALLLLAECAEAMGEIDEARTALRTYLRRWPRGAFAVDVRQHLSDLNRRVMRGEIGHRPLTTTTTTPPSGG
jgi:TolA-binding protein